MLLICYENILGDWWVLRGVNCGDSVYPGGYDWYPCQHERFIKESSGQWINKVMLPMPTVKSKCFIRLHTAEDHLINV